MIKQMKDLNWSFSKIWNKSLEQSENRPLSVRNHIWASEIGGSYLDRYLKMNAVVPSNPFESRSLRKFEAGRVFEWIVEMVLLRAGILISKQNWLEFAYPNLLKVTGKLDHLAGGNPDYEKAKASIESEILPDFIKRTATNVLDHFAKAYPKGLATVVLEVKSVGSQMFHRYDLYHTADRRHSLQLYHYLKATGINEGHIVYISKDDLCLAEVAVFGDSEEMEQGYKGDIEKMTYYITHKEQPPKELPIEFDDIAGRFITNWKISYSPYLTKMYGFKNQEAFEKTVKPRVARWNRVIGRIKDGKTMTADNNEALKDIKLAFSNLDELIELAKKSKEIEDESSD